MNIPINFNFFLLAKSEKAKEKVINKITDLLVDKVDRSVVHVDECNFVINIEYKSWELLVYRALQICQLIGGQWVLTGNVNFEFNAWSNHAKIIGIESIGITIDNPIVT